MAIKTHSRPSIKFSVDGNVHWTRSLFDLCLDMTSDKNKNIIFRKCPSKRPSYVHSMSVQMEEGSGAKKTTLDNISIIGPISSQVSRTGAES